MQWDYLLISRNKSSFFLYRLLEKRRSRQDGCSAKELERGKIKKTKTDLVFCLIPSLFYVSSWNLGGLNYGIYIYLSRFVFWEIFSSINHIRSFRVSLWIFIFCFFSRLRMEKNQGVDDLSAYHEVHVLVVDDSLVDRKVIERLFKITSCKG